jgi:broad specificity phosphatase PhoE
VRRPEVWLLRHGETDWSRDGRHTSHTDLMLTPAGVDQARSMVASLSEAAFDLVLTSPLRRAGDTAALVGFPDARGDPALAEWHYGDYEGLTTPQIREQVPGWTVWTDDPPGGETAEQVGARADRIITRVLDEADERALLVAHGHLLRVLAARWLHQAPAFGRHLVLGTATLSVLGWERDTRAITRWNASPSATGPARGRPPQPPVGAGVEPGAAAGPGSGSEAGVDRSEGVRPGSGEPPDAGDEPGTDVEPNADRGSGVDMGSGVEPGQP